MITRDDELISYGNLIAQERLMQVYPIDIPLSAGPNQWLVKRTESQFLWGWLEIDWRSELSGGWKNGQNQRQTIIFGNLSSL